MAKREQVQLKVNSKTKKAFKKRIEEEELNMTEAIGLATKDRFDINLTK